MRFQVLLIALLAGVGRAAEWPGVIHVHSRLSHDSTGSFTEIAAAARQAGARFVILTDHQGPGVPDDQPSGMFDGVLFIPGVEDAHLLSLGVHRPLHAATLAARVREIHAQGGLAFVAHPESFDRWDLPGLDGTEIYNLHADAQDDPKWLLVPRWLLRAWRDPLKAMLAFLDEPTAVHSRWDARAARERFPGLAGNDAHANVRVLGWTLDPYARQFRFVRTVVKAPRLDAPSILAALKAGRSRVEFTVLGDPGPVGFFLRSGSFMIRAPVPSTLQLIRDGLILWTRPTPPDGRLCVPPSGPGSYRLEIRTTYGRREYPWVLTNHIRIGSGR